MSALCERHCQAKASRLSGETARRLLGEIPGWAIEGETLARSYAFRNFHETMAFVNLVAYIAHREDHHPDLAVSYNLCRVVYQTHSVNGLSENDFICAARIDAADAA
ncbi:MAG: 4a-hydroxytetrahydrobiopterin dehydratase [Betaproteobacteria bacterium]|nr:4a-hydroxytetrahydrobiopterin dehydratase [Betaproteobacteria bacterium]